MTPEPGGGAPFAEEATGQGALSGLVVADFSRVLAGPLATMMLGDLGATVIKVEEPAHGDDSRAWGPPYVDGASTYYLSINRNKRSIALDLRTTQGAAIARRVAARADVMVENFRAGRLAQYSLDYDSVVQTNPAVIYCSISGFGSGPGSVLAGYDFIAQAVGGLMSITGDEEGPPTKVGVAVVDVLTGLHACIGILAALAARAATGQGQRIEVNLLSSLIASLINQGSAYANTGVVPRAMGNRHPSVVPYETFRTAEGVLAVAVGNDSQFRSLCLLLGMPALGEDERFSVNAARVRNRNELIEVLERALASDTAAQWAVRMHEAGVPCGPINDIAGAFQLADALGLHPITTMRNHAGAAIAQLSNPIQLSKTPPRYTLPPPTLGGDDEAILQWLADLEGNEGGPVTEDRPEPLRP
jgi:crotonobetainyl-CoA:carnitine CoA-transferase CaiB-like acyl-CoA transferase